jgi:hypothetical protein
LLITHNDCQARLSIAFCAKRGRHYCRAATENDCPYFALPKMSRRTTRRSRPEAPLSISAPPWTGGPCVELVHEFNERFVEQVAESAREDDERAVPDMVRMHRDLWVSLDGPARRRASQCPFLLADVQFRNVTWWQRAQNDASWHGGPPNSVRLFSRKPAVELMRDALVVAWYTARQDTRLAATLLAMSDDVARVVAKLGLRHLRHIADHHHQHLRPRWQHLSSFWGRLLSAASRDDREALHDLHLHAFQLADADSGSAACAPDSSVGVRYR